MEYDDRKFRSYLNTLNRKDLIEVCITLKKEQLKWIDYVVKLEARLDKDKTFDELLEGMEFVSDTNIKVKPLPKLDLSKYSYNKKGEKI